MIGKLLSLVKNDIVLFLKSNSKLFNNERDFQVNLAQYLINTKKYDDVILEYNIPQGLIHPDENVLKSKEIRIDIVVVKSSEYLPIELKYKTKTINKPLIRFGEQVSEKTLKNQGAQDLGMYDFWLDVYRLEGLCERFSIVKNGIAIFLTNDKSYENAPKEKSINYLFSMVEGKKLPKQKYWKQTAKITTNRPGFVVKKEYSIVWNIAKLEGNEFHFCLLEI